LKTAVLFTRVYGQYRNRLSETMKTEISSLVSELDAALTQFTVDKRGHILLGFEGQDAEFAINFLTKEYGTSVSLESLVEGTKVRGSLIDVGKVGFGIYVDIAATSDQKQVDALVPLYKIRDLFKIKKPLRTIAKSLVLVDNLPVELLITSVDRGERKLEATLSENTMNRFNEWLHDDHERLLVFGANRLMIDDALKKSGHQEDIYEIQELGKFEYSLRCKRSTRASGIIAAIGPRLRGIPMHLFIPKEVEAKLNAQA
jgi:hypothetical protein